MFYADKQSEEDEKLFQEKLAAVRAYMANERVADDARITLVMQEGWELLKKKTMTKEELERLDEIQAIMIARKERLLEIQAILKEDCFRYTSETYHDIKTLAEKSNDPILMQAYLDLKPHYLKKLRDNMNDN